MKRTLTFQVVCGILLIQLNSIVSDLGSRKRLFATNLMKTAGYISEASEDKVPRFFWGTAGKGNADIEPDVTVFSGEDNLLMITEVRVVYLEHEGIKLIKCFDFTYGDGSNHCQSTGSLKVDTFVLDKDEYITEVSGTSDFFINKLSLQTNKRSIGPYGDVGSTARKFTAKNRGAPLLFAQIKSGIWLYEMSFTFLEYPVLELKNFADQVSKRVYDIVTSHVSDIHTVWVDYKHMLGDAARKGCYMYKSKKSPGGLYACNLQSMLEQVNILATSTNTHMHHLPRNLIGMADYDSRRFLEQVGQSRAFHDLITQLKFDIQTVIDVTEEQSHQLQNYFSEQAEFDMDIAKQDVAYIQGVLKRTKKGAAETSDKVGSRLRQIIGVGLGIVVAEAADQAVKLAVVIAENANPFKWIFGGPEIEDIMEATEDFLEATRNVAKMASLQANLKSYLKLATRIAENFAANAKQIAAMNDLVNKFDTISDTEEIENMAQDFVQCYGEYTPMVTSQDIVYMTQILDTVGNEACTIISESHGLISDVTALIYESITNDCLYLPADQAKLDSYYQDTYSLQFELVDALTKVVRANVALHMSKDIGKVGKTIDVETAAIGSTMVEIQYQAAAQVRCDILEYVDAGKRPDVCEDLLFTQTDINRLISYTGHLPKSHNNIFAYFPTSFKEGRDEPFINITNLLSGKQVTFLLPINNSIWLKKYNWLQGHFDQETAFYYELIEPYIPGLKCNESGQPPNKVYTELTSAKPQVLYQESSEPTYTIYQQLVKFSYTDRTDECPGQTMHFPVKNNRLENVNSGDEVCVTSNGVIGDVTAQNRDDYAFPSLYSMWRIQVSTEPGCTLVLDPHLDFMPLITFHLKIREVAVKTNPVDPGINECWPDGSRCPPNEYCADQVLGFSCQKFDLMGLIDTMFGKAYDDLHVKV